MAIVRAFRVTTNLGSLFTSMDSLGRHLASKLQLFRTDERTLTDELCDMFYIWNQEDTTSRPSRFGRLPEYKKPSLDVPLTVHITKETQQDEAVTGCDLGLLVTTPTETKFAVIQAKVFDPDEERLRCDSTQEWGRLAQQLILMRAWLSALDNDDMGFVAVYLPRSKLGEQVYPHGTYETGSTFPDMVPTRTDPKYGISLVKVSDLLNRRNRWLIQPAPYIRVLADGSLNPNATTLSALLIDMLTCRRGQPYPPGLRPESGPFPSDEEHGLPFNYRARNLLALRIEGTSPLEWSRYIDALRRDFPEGST